MRHSALLLVVTASLVPACAGANATSAPEPEHPVPVAVVVQTPAPVESAAPARALSKTEAADDDQDEPKEEAEDGQEAESAIGTMFGSEIGESFGAGGLGLSGIGPSAGGTGTGIGLGSLGTMGHGAGTGSGYGVGSGSGRLGTGKPSSQVQIGATTMSGRLPPEVIQRIVRMNLARIRYCYERELVSDPNLEGRVTVRFVIGRDGAVASSGVTSSTLGNASVTSCVVAAFQRMQFPKPDGGVVVVSYPLVFRNADASTTPADAGAPARDAGADAPTGG